MSIDEIIQELNDQIQTLEDMKTNILELQEETRGLVAGVNMWLEEHLNELPEAKGE